MGKKLNVYLSEDALQVLDDLVEQRKRLWSESSNRSNTISDLLVQQGRVYRESLKLVRAAIRRHAPGPQMQRALEIARAEGEQ